MVLDGDEEGHRFLAVDDAVVIVQGEIHHRADDDLTADGLIGQVVQDCPPLESHPSHWLTAIGKLSLPIIQN